ncbi:hypothetical protein H6G35_22770 [Aulosira sp. FACHB-113]|nr:hypothetical protein [Aulosira sp. FACHB-113]
MKKRLREDEGDEEDEEDEENYYLCSRSLIPFTQSVSERLAKTSTCSEV